MVDLTRKFDVLVIGGGNAALCAAISARRAGASVLVLEGAPKFYRGGNTRHTRNMRCAHDAATDDPDRALHRGGVLGRSAARHRRPDRRGAGASYMIRESKDILNWIVEQGVRCQPSLGGTLSLGRTNSFFLGGGRAMLNALYLTAEKLGVEIRLRRRGDRPRDRATACSCRPRVQQGDADVTRPRRDAGRRRRRLRGQHRVAEGILGRGRRQFPDPRHALQPRLGPEDAARQGRAGRSAIRPSATRWRSTRARRNSTAASSPGSTAWCSASSSTSTPQRFYDEGEDIWPKRYAIWGRLVAAQPDQIAYIIFDAAVARPASCRRCFRRSRRRRIAELAGKLELDPAALEKTVTDFNAAVRPGTFDHTILDDCRTEGLTPPKTHWARQHRDARPSTPIRCGPASPSPISAPA